MLELPAINLLLAGVNDDIVEPWIDLLPNVMPVSESNELLDRFKPPKAGPPSELLSCDCCRSTSDCGKRMFENRKRDRLFGIVNSLLVLRPPKLLLFISELGTTRDGTCSPDCSLAWSDSYVMLEAIKELKFELVYLLDRLKLMLHDNLTLISLINIGSLPWEVARLQLS